MDDPRAWAALYRRMAVIMRKHGCEHLAKIWEANAEKFERMNDDGVD